MQIEYLLFNIFIVAGPLAALKLYPNTKLPKLIPSAFSIGIAAIIFIGWDLFVVDWFWHFNKLYVLGLTIAGLPFEELLFFMTVPFACLFLWVNRPKKSNTSYSMIPEALIVVSSIVAAFSLYYSLWYSGLVFVVFSLIILFDWLIGTRLFFQKQFLLFLALVGLLTLVFNMYLTARPIVLYDEAVKTNINIYTLPIEDIIYGWALIGLVIVIYEYISSTRSLSPSQACQ